MRTIAPTAQEPAKPTSRPALQAEMPPVVRAALASEGTPLEPTLKRSMESQFGQDFSQVRVHTDGIAAQSAKALNAKAYTVGQDIVFGANRYGPGTSDGSRLIAHELAHVLHQASSNGASDSSAATEGEAASVAAAVEQGKQVRVGLSAPTCIQRDPEDDDSQKPGGQKAESRPRFDPEKAARSAQKMVADYQGRLIDEGGGLVEIFNRSGNLYDAQKRRGAAGELGAITDFLDYGAPDGRIVATLRILPSRKGSRSPDAHIKFTDGTEAEALLEVTAITSAPGIRGNAPATTIRPTVFPDQKATQAGLVDATRQREVTVTDLKNAIRRKAVVAAQLNAPQQERLPDGQSRNIARGGYVVIDIPFGTKVDASMIEDAMKDFQINPNVQGIVFKFRVVSESGTTTARISYSRTPTGFVGRPWDVSAGSPAQLAPPVGTSANPANNPSPELAARVEPKVEPKPTAVAPKSPAASGGVPAGAANPPVDEPRIRVGEVPPAQTSQGAPAEKPRLRVGEQPPASGSASTGPRTKISIVDGRAVNTDDLVGVIGAEEPGSGSGSQQVAKKAMAASAPRSQATTGTAGASSAGASARPAGTLSDAASTARQVGEPEPPKSGAPRVAVDAQAAQSAKGPSTGGVADPPRSTAVKRIYTGRPATSNAVRIPSQEAHASSAQQDAANIAVMLELTRARLEDIADDDERDKAETWLVRNRPAIYQTLFEHPGAGMLVQFHFERINGRLSYNGATQDLMPAGVPPVASNEDTLDIAGTGIKLFFPPVRKRPAPAGAANSAPQTSATPRGPVLSTAEAVIQALPESSNLLRSYDTLVKLQSEQGPMGPFTLTLGNQSRSMTADALMQAVQAYRLQLESSFGERHRQVLERVDQVQKKLEAALTTHSNFASKWWYRKRIGLLDPHGLDQPRAHASAVPHALHRGDFQSAAASLKAADELMDRVEDSIHQFGTGEDRGEEREL